MKVTAIISDELIKEVKKLTQGKNITESVTIALKEWLALKKVKELNQIIREEPLEFDADFSAERAREISRR
ncbi:MAG: hypothetical protein K8S14_05985 [Actinomycetia bacterium]|nr:hypothetical protein [Actinomycetes bacterium]